jgi:hypothetical protein
MQKTLLLPTKTGGRVENIVQALRQAVFSKTFRRNLCHNALFRENHCHVTTFCRNFMFL